MRGRPPSPADIEEALPNDRARRYGPRTHPRGARWLAGFRATLVDAVERSKTIRGTIEPPRPNEKWRNLDLDTETLSKMAPDTLLEMLTDVSPDISRALWDFLRMCNPGWEAIAIDLKGKQIGGPAQEALDAFLLQLKALYGSLDVVIGRLYIGAFLRGGFFGELVLDRTGKRPIDFATPDPRAARFRWKEDRDRGGFWQLGQWQNGTWIDIPDPTVRYIPIDPPPGSPYGRPLAMPALFTAIFLVGLLHDLRRVVAQQGYPRLDIEVSIDEILKAMPEDLEEDPQAFKEFVEDTLAAVTEVYASLQPDDAYVHTSGIKVNRPVGAVDASSLGAVDGLIRALERMTIRALKTMPLLMGSNEGVTETSANRQWEVYAAGVKALQHLAESLLEYLFGLALQAQGIPAAVKFRFAELRASELMRDAQVQQLRTQNAWLAWLYGWISHDEAALEAVGHKADLEEPRYLPSNLVPNAATMPNLLTVNPDPGSAREVKPLDMSQFVPGLATEARNRERRDLFWRQWSNHMPMLPSDESRGGRRVDPDDIRFLIERGWTPQRLARLIRAIEAKQDDGGGDRQGEPPGPPPLEFLEKPPYTPDKLKDYPSLVQPQSVGAGNGALNGKGDANGTRTDHGAEDGGADDLPEL